MKTTICLSCALSLTFLSLLTTCQGQRFTATPSESYYITRGRPATLECEIENVDNIQFACSKELPESRLLVNGHVRNDGVEVLKATFKVIREDIQGYSSKSPFWCECVGETDSGNLIRSRRSEIKPAFLKREFKSHPRSKSAPIGSKVEFLCGPPSGQPQPQISWQKDGRRLNTEKDKNLLINDRGMLVIKQLRQKDLGRYTCMARNIASKRVSNPATLTIGDASVDDRLEASDAPLEDGPVYEKEPDTLYYVTSEKSVDITCRVVGANILTVRCNNRRLLENEQKARETSTPEGKIFETTWTVTADEIRRYGADGSYSCYCVSWYTQPGAQGWLSKESAKGYIELAFMDQDFIAHPRSQTVRVDSSVTLTCTAPRSKPPAEIKWYFNNNELDMNAGIYVIDETSGSLTLESVTMRDAGDYKCSASNRAGTQFSKTARLTVQNGAVRPTDTGSSIPTATTRPPTTRAPTTPARQPGEAHFSTPLEKVYYLTDDEPAVITCGVKSADMITFRCNGRRYERDEINEIRKDYDRKIGKFNIESAIEVTASELAQAGGEYKCICTMWVTVGGNWERKESGPARVEKAFIEDEFAMEPVDTEVQIGFPAELICSPPFGGPEPQVSWMRNRERIDPSKDSNIEITMSGSLSILSMRKKYEGRYTCMASNVAGVRSTEPARLKALERKESVTDAITESILVDEASTAEPIDYTPFRETEPSSEPETGGTRGAPMFIEEPKTTYYIVKGQFITITCTAKNVLNIAFRCSGMTVPNYRYENNQVTSRNTVSISLELSREDVEGFTDDNSCVCDAFYRPHGSDEEKKLTSSPGYVNLAYIKKRFRKNPEDVTTTEGMMAALPCTPPEALPRPEVYWLFNGQRIDSLLGTNIVQPDDNSLVFVNPTADLSGDYTCVAENVAGKRTSNTARVTVEVPRGAVDQGVVYPETTSEPEGEPEGATSEPEPEPEDKTTTMDHDHVHGGHHVHHGGAYPETTSYYMTSGRENEYEVKSEPTISMESESSPEPKEDTDESVAMVTDESMIDRDDSTDSIITMTTKSTKDFDSMTTVARGEKSKGVGLPGLTSKSTDSIRKKPMTTESMDMEPMKTEPMGQKPMTTVTLEVKPMATDSTAMKPLSTDNYDTEISNEIDSMNPKEKSKKKPKRPKPTSKKFKKCQEQMSICNRYFTERVRPAEEQQDMEAKCQAANEYSTCVDDFVDKCKNEIKANAIDTILYTRERITSSCRDEGNVVHANLGPYESCNELQMCTRHLTEGDGIFEDVRSACNSLTSMLMCGDSALSKCDIKNTANGDTSLSTIGEWYSKYCNKVVMERTSFVTCESLRPCNTPFNASTSVKDMYDVNMWCPYTYSVLSCTRNALDNCQPEEREGIEADLRMLQSEAADICPREGQNEEVIDVGETIGDDDNGASAVISTSSILISCVHVVFLLVLSLR